MILGKMKEKCQQAHAGSNSIVHETLKIIFVFSYPSSNLTVHHFDFPLHGSTVVPFLYHGQLSHTIYNQTMPFSFVSLSPILSKQSIVEQVQPFIIYLLIYLANHRLFAWTYQPGLSSMEQCFSLTTNQLQPAYQSQKPSANHGCVLIGMFPMSWS